MAQDIEWKEFLADNDRYADIINGIVSDGKQVVTGSDLHELDTQGSFLRGPRFVRRWNPKKGRRKIKIRDTLRKAAFGVNFAIIGIENQESIDYSMPLRNMSYDVGEYEKQAAKIRMETRKEPKGLNSGEYLYGFRKGSRMQPVVTFILYSGEEEWDGPESLHGMIDFTDIPEKIIGMVPDYQINLIEIRKLTDTSVFKTDVRQVLNFIKQSENKTALKALVESDASYKNMEEDAYDIIAHYTNATELIKAKIIILERTEKWICVKRLRSLLRMVEKRGEK